MSELVEAYTTKNWVVYKKVKAKDGRVMRFKDGTPINEHQYHGGKSQQQFKGTPVYVAVPSDKGPGYERKRINPQQEASALGKELSEYKKNPDRAQDTVMIEGETYDIETIADLNERIYERHGDILFRYT